MNKQKTFTKKTCEKIKREKYKVDPNLTPLTAILIKIPEYKNLCKNISINKTN